MNHDTQTISIELYTDPLTGKLTRTATDEEFEFQELAELVDPSGDCLIITVDREWERRADRWDAQEGDYFGCTATHMMTEETLQTLPAELQKRIAEQLQEEITELAMDCEQ